MRLAPVRVLVLSLALAFLIILYRYEHGLGRFNSHEYCHARVRQFDALVLASDALSRLSSSKPTPSPPQPQGPPAQSISGKDFLESYDFSTRTSPYIPSRTLPNSSVTLLIHQSWKSPQLPARFISWSSTWRTHYSGWTYVLWTDDDNRLLVERYFPAYLAAYDALPREIYRADMVRNCYLALFGGVYADLDTEAVENVGSLLEEFATKFTTDGISSAEVERQLALGMKPQVAYVSRLYRGKEEHPAHMPNAWMASSAGHPFWRECLEFVNTALEIRPTEAQVERTNAIWSTAATLPFELPSSAEPFPGGEGVMTWQELTPEWLTGPVALWKSYYAYLDRHPLARLSVSDLTHGHAQGVALAASLIGEPRLIDLPGRNIFPYSWESPVPTEACLCSAQGAGGTFDPVKCKRLFRGARSITYWSNSWGAPNWSVLDEGEEKQKVKEEVEEAKEKGRRGKERRWRIGRE